MKECVRILKRTIVLAIFIVPAACSSNNGQSYYVRNSQSVPPLVVPPGVQNPTKESYYPVPPIPASVIKPSLVPPGSHILKTT